MSSFKIFSRYKYERLDVSTKSVCLRETEIKCEFVLYPSIQPLKGLRKAVPLFTEEISRAKCSASFEKPPREIY